MPYICPPPTQYYLFFFSKMREEVDPVHHRLEHRLRAYLFVCMLAYRLLSVLQWKLKEASGHEDSWERADALLHALGRVERVEVTFGSQYLKRSVFFRNFHSILRYHTPPPKKHHLYRPNYWLYHLMQLYDEDAGYMLQDTQCGRMLMTFQTYKNLGMYQSSHDRAIEIHKVRLMCRAH